MISYKMTCGACPEQYDAFHHGKRVGYLRLRHGSFTVEHPDCGGDRVYEAEPKGDGVFESGERHKYLTEATKALEQKLGRPITGKYRIDGATAEEWMMD